MKDPIVLVVAFVVLLAVFLFSRTLRRKQQARPGLFEGREAESRARDQLEQLIVQVQDVSREQIAKADMKIRMLNQLIQEADRKIKELGAALEKPAPPVPRPAPAPAPRPVNPLHERIFALQDQGKSPSEICVETNMEIGEVDMILGLRKLQQS